MKSTKTPYVTDKDGKDLYIKMRYSGIHTMVVLIDCISLFFPRKGKTAYLKVIDVIKWHEEEIRITEGQGGNRIILKHLREALDKFKSEQAEPSPAPPIVRQHPNPRHTNQRHVRLK
jgi:hypothetical protein